VLLILSSIAFAAAARRRWFRLYSFATLLTVLAFGAWTGLEGPKLAANQPTPWIGMTERISIGAWLLWVVILAVVLLREERAEAYRRIVVLHRAG
jgi:cytochrome bd-type quinol oxidase subunit 2